MNSLSTRTEQEEHLAQRLVAAGIRETDLEESFVRSGGPGGQNLNKTATCVVLRHRPTGLLVKCQTTRHQGQNRQLARELLLAKVEAVRRQQVAAERARLEKLRRQKRGRSRSAKERILADKAHRATRKQARQRPAAD